MTLHLPYIVSYTSVYIPCIKLITNDDDNNNNNTIKYVFALSQGQNSFIIALFAYKGAI